MSTILSVTLRTVVRSILYFGNQRWVFGLGSYSIICLSQDQQSKWNRHRCQYTSRSREPVFTFPVFASGRFLERAIDISIHQYLPLSCNDRNLAKSTFYGHALQGKMGVTNSVAGDDAATRVKVRYDFNKGSYIADMMGLIHSDIFFKDRLMLKGVNLRIKLNRAKNSFCLISSPASPTFKVITEATLFVRRVKLASSILLGQ